MSIYGYIEKQKDLYIYIEKQKDPYIDLYIQRITPHRRSSKLRRRPITTLVIRDRQAKANQRAWVSNVFRKNAK